MWKWLGLEMGCGTQIKVGRWDWGSTCFPSFCPQKVCEFSMGLDMYLLGGLCVAGGVPGYTTCGSDGQAPEPTGGGGSCLAGGRPGLPTHRGPDWFLLRASAPGPTAA